MAATAGRSLAAVALGGQHCCLELAAAPPAAWMRVCGWLQHLNCHGAAGQDLKGPSAADHRQAPLFAADWWQVLEPHLGWGEPAQRSRVGLAA